ncbi:hypothetical protein SK128_016024 [Halocaridina rubra]|uniref:CUB domain-containing protein n=1 Tax=Halocaridina rubra TaxID=373956 RepID=A0AAN9AFF8_HALRR
MMVAYIPCSAEVPTKCGQYFTGLNGTIVSYNYNVDSYYLAGLSYSICFRKEKGHCTYTLMKTSDNQFIEAEDTLRLMMGISIPAPPNPNLFGSAIACRPRGSVKFSQMYYTNVQCLYPDSMTSVHKNASFFVTVRTLINDFPKFNNLVVSPIYSGFQFNWTHNLCE